MPVYRFHFHTEADGYVEVEADSEGAADEMLADGEVELPELCIHCSGAQITGVPWTELGEWEFREVERMDQ